MSDGTWEIRYRFWDLTSAMWLGKFGWLVMKGETTWGEKGRCGCNWVSMRMIWPMDFSFWMILKLFQIDPECLVVKKTHPLPTSLSTMECRNAQASRQESVDAEVEAEKMLQQVEVPRSWELGKAKIPNFLFKVVFLELSGIDGSLNVTGWWRIFLFWGKYFAMIAPKEKEICDNTKNPSWHQILKIGQEFQQLIPVYTEQRQVPCKFWGSWLLSWTSDPTGPSRKFWSLDYVPFWITGAFFLWDIWGDEGIWILVSSWDISGPLLISTGEGIFVHQWAWKKTWSWWRIQVHGTFHGGYSLWEKEFSERSPNDMGHLVLYKTQATHLETKREEDIKRKSCATQSSPQNLWYDIAYLRKREQNKQFWSCSIYLRMVLSWHPP